MARHASAHARTADPRPRLTLVPRTAAAEARVDATPRPVRGILLGAAMAIPVWGGIGLAVHTLWTLVR